jgi:hypothetical protein
LTWRNLIVVAFLLSTTVGMLRYCSPVPFHDEWRTCYQIAAAVNSGQLSALFTPNSGHRAVIAHLAFWADLKLAGGRFVIPFALNLGLLVAMFVCLEVGAGRLLNQCRHIGFRADVRVLQALACFSWLNGANLTRATQPQLFGSLLFPLAAFLALGQSANARLPGEATTVPKHRAMAWLYFAALLGVLSAGTQGNGVVVLPLLVLLALLLRLPMRCTLQMSVVALLCLSAFFYRYPLGHLSGGVTSTPSTVAILQWTLAYLGNAWFAVSRSGIGAQCAGACLVLLWSYAAVSSFRSRRSDTFSLGLAAFLAYVLGSAVMGGITRAGLGVASASAPRYWAVSLVAWAAVATILAGRFQHHPDSRGFLRAVVLGVLLLAIPAQLETVSGDPRPEHLNRWVAALGLELGAWDPDFAKYSVVRLEERVVTDIVAAARLQRLGIFGSPPLAGLRSFLGRSATQEGLRQVESSVDRVEEIAGTGSFRRVRGWAFELESTSIPERVFLVDTNGEIVGVALTGVERPDLIGGVDPHALFAGFIGYVRSGADRRQLSAWVERAK